MKIVDQPLHVSRAGGGDRLRGNGRSAAAARSPGEYGAVVALHQPGTPGDFALVLGQASDAPAFVVICGHGDEIGLSFGDYAPDIDTSCVVQGRMPARALADKIKQPGRVVLSTACSTGAPEFGKAFIAGGVRAYIAAASYPEGAAAFLFVHHFFYGILCCSKGSEVAYLHARGNDEENAKFSLQGK